MAVKLFQFILLFFSFELLLKVNCGGSFQLKVLQFVNNEGLDELGRCCADPGADQCSDPCPTSFRICLTHFQRQVNPQSPCTYGKATTPVLGTNSFAPTEHESLKNKSIEFAFSFRWPGYFSLIIDVLGKRNSSASTGQSEVLLSRLVTSGIVYAKSEGENVWQKPSPYVHRNSELHYAYRVICGRLLYGPGCTTYCQPRNDVFGHYTCSRLGQKECLPGWSGSEEEGYCTKAVCKEGCSAEHGDCVSPNTCQCAIGWKGKDCSECDILPGCLHGTCTKAYECICKSGWGGQYCNQDLNYCTHNKPCHNGALCSNTGRGSYTCTCEPGYTGKNCQIDINECESNPCVGNETCVDLINGYRCNCTDNCIRNPVQCSEDPCRNGGVCKVDVKRGHVCECVSGWAGKSCERSIKQCRQNLCQNGGSCQETSSGAVCLCSKGYTGKFCLTPLNPCADKACLNGGKCSHPRLPFLSCECDRCSCPPLYFGQRCEDFAGQATNNPVSSTLPTKVIVVAERGLNTGQWIAICFGSGLLVLLLVLLAACLAFYRKRLFQTKTDFTESTPEEQSRCVRKIESIVIVTDNSNRRSLFAVDQNFSKLLDNDKLANKSKKSASKLTYPAIGKVESIEPSEKRQNGHRKQISGDQSSRHSSTEFSACTCEASSGGNASPSIQQPSNESHDSRLPTYEEVCKESDTFLRQGVKHPASVKGTSC